MHLFRSTLLATLALLATACGEMPTAGVPVGTTGGSAPATVTADPDGDGDGSSTTGGGTDTSTGGSSSSSSSSSTGGTSTTTTTGGTINGVACPTYAGFAQGFFTSTCSKCHAANMKEPNYQDINNVMKDIKNIKTKIDNGSMPDGGPKVTGTTLTNIDNWMDPNCRK